MHNNQNSYPSDKSLSNIFDPPSPSSQPADEIHSPPPPAYSALPHRDVEFHLAPMLEGKLGDVELETVDGKRFLVHKKVLENETVFFQIYYGFVPVWRLNNAVATNATTVPIHFTQTHQTAITQRETVIGTNTLNNLLCLPKLLASHLARGTSPSGSPPAQEDIVPPPLPPKDTPAPPHTATVSAPTPTASPYIWAVPETCAVLTAFLSLIYPRGTFTSSPTSLLTNLDLTGRVIRASLGYQSSKALNLSRDRLYSFIDAKPIEVYAMASFFKFADLARLASYRANDVPPERWDDETRSLMGRSAMTRLVQLQDHRRERLCEILSRQMECDAHSETCLTGAQTRNVWEEMTRWVKEGLQTGRIGVGTELFVLLQVDLRGASHCGDCLVLLGKSIQRSLYEAKDLPRCI